MFKNFVGVLAFVFVSFIGSAQVEIIPQPESVVVAPTGGKFTLNEKTTIIATDPALQHSADFFNDYLKEYYGFRLKEDRKPKHKNVIYLHNLKQPGTIPGAYSLNVKKDGVNIEGQDEVGVFYGIQTLIQLLPVERSSSLPIQEVSIKDAPRFAYRGMHLDVGRHFFPVSFVKKYIDFIALHKMNYFHWHLTEDQGWRIEIKKYPKLTQVGAYRDGTIIGHYPGTGNDNIHYGGYYTQDEVRDIVKYAADRYITIIPEIEMPGHSSAAIAAYPWLSCFPDKPTDMKEHPSLASQKQGGKQVQETWGVFPDVYCAGNDSTFKFLENVLDEVIALFPSKYIHIGGDECPKDNWKICPKCQKRIRDNHLKDENELQSYVIQRIEKYLNSKGRQIIGWDEILEGGLAPNAIVMSWRGEEGGIAAAKQNHKVIMTPGNYVYFDHSQYKNDDSVTIGGLTTLHTVYNYEPIPVGLPAGSEQYIMGAQANVWTEYIAYPSKVEYMIFPRMSALSEVLWSPKASRNWDSFKKRMELQDKRYKLWGANYGIEKSSNLD